MIDQIFAKQLADKYFWPCVNKTDTCWIFTANIMGAKGNKRGHIRFRGARGRYILIKAHRFSFVLHFGELSDKEKVLHRCDNTLCVKPEDIFKGTQAQNISDMISKNRHSRGESHNSKLAQQQVNNIRETYATGKTTHRKLAYEYKVSHSVIRNIVIGKKWRESFGTRTTNPNN